VISDKKKRKQSSNIRSWQGYEISIKISQGKGNRKRNERRSLGTAERKERKKAIWEHETARGAGKMIIPIGGSLPRRRSG